MPDLMLDDIAFGVLGPEDGYANPKQVLLDSARREAAGAKYLTDEVVAIGTPVVVRCQLKSGGVISTPLVVMPQDRGQLAISPACACRYRPCARCCFAASCRSTGRIDSRCWSIPDGGTGATTIQTADDRDAIILAFTNWEESPRKPEPISNAGRVIRAGDDEAPPRSAKSRTSPVGPGSTR
jgi:hypothetical protein